jgi:signal transduction histidine kinase
MLERPRSRLAAILAFWTLLSVFAAIQIHWIDAQILGRPSSWIDSLLWALAFWYSWAALAPIVVGLTRLCIREGIRFTVSLRLQLPACLFLALAHLAILMAAARAGIVFAGPFRSAYAVHFQWNLLIYWTLVGATHAFHYYDRYRERELEASQLEAELARAQLQTLRAQLQPHFLFNTLNAISTLIENDAEAAERMVGQLGDLLRASLRQDATVSVPLAQDLELLDRYLSIEKTRFADRLSVELDIEPQALEARVPNLLLQPLVENAVRHAVAPRTETGTIEIRAWRENENLRLEVRDDGPGLLDPTAPPAGIGLSNTRARLERLHHARHRFELSNVPGGGLLVSVTLPFQTGAPS